MRRFIIAALIATSLLFAVAPATPAGAVDGCLICNNPY
jgi:hypothetical protein